MTRESIHNLLKGAKAGDLAPDAPVFPLGSKVGSIV